MFVTPSGGLIPYLFVLLGIYSNDIVEYEALIIGLKLAIQMRIDQPKMFGDLQLIIRQIND